MSATILPNFLIIGAHKCGTTSLYEYLRQHPQVFMPQLKEPSFFTFENQNLDHFPAMKRNVVTRFEDYADLFREANGYAAVGEASPMYFKCSYSAANIKRHLPHARLILILRNPLERAYSHFQMELRNGTVKSRNFAEAIHEYELLPDGIRYQRYIHDGKYFTLLKPYLDLFGAENILVLLFDQLRSDPFGLMKSVFEFLGIDDEFMPDLSEKHNEGGLWRNPLWKVYYRNIHPALGTLAETLPEDMRARLAAGAKKMRRSAVVKPPELSAQTKTELTVLFREEILKLQDLIRQDLTGWLESQPAHIAKR